MKTVQSAAVMRASRLALAAAPLLALVCLTGRAETLSRLGEPLTPDLESVSIGSILDDPEGWEGERVRIEGTVDGVCAMKGCWMEIVSPQDRRLRVKVEDDVIVFPSKAIGRHAVAEGTVEIVEMTRESYVAWLRHLADELASDEAATDFDPDSVGDGPYRIVQVRGLGAEVSLP